MGVQRLQSVRRWLMIGCVAGFSGIAIAQQLPQEQASIPLAVQTKVVGKMAKRELSSPKTDAANQHIVYLEQRDGKRCVVVDGVAGALYDEIEPHNVVLGPNGGRVAYVAVAGGKQRAVVDGTEGPSYTGVRRLQFSPDGKHVAYVGASLTEGGAPPEVVFDGVVKSKDVDYETLAFLADGRLLWSQYDKPADDWQRKPKLVADGRPLDTAYAPQGILANFHLSADANHYAFQAEDPATFKRVFVLDGKPVSVGAAPLQQGPVLSPDGQHWVALATVNAKVAVVVDGVVGSPFDKVNWATADRNLIMFSSNGAHCAYTGIRDEKTIVVLDGKEIAECAAVRAGPVFSSDGSKLALVGVKDGKPYYMVHGGEGAIDCLDAGEMQIAASPDGRLAVTGMWSATGWSLRIDGKTGREFRSCRAPVFSPNGKHVAYAAGLSGDKWALVVDDAVSEPFDDLPAFGTRIAFDGNETVRVFARNGTDLVAVTAKLADK